MAISFWSARHEMIATLSDDGDKSQITRKAEIHINPPFFCSFVDQFRQTLQFNLPMTDGPHFQTVKENPKG
jgi:hypothetical protein